LEARSGAQGVREKKKSGSPVSQNCFAYPFPVQSLPVCRFANETAVKIARAELSAICRAVGVMAPKDSIELHDLPLVIKVKVKRRKDTEELQNEIAGYEPKDAVAGKPVQATTSTPPWRRSG
jgi:hypothetical protein